MLLKILGKAKGEIITRDGRVRAAATNDFTFIFNPTSYKFSITALLLQSQLQTKPSQIS